jgi:hypothetical protein
MATPALRDQQARISAKDAPGLRAEIDQALDKLK